MPGSWEIVTQGSCRPPHQRIPLQRQQTPDLEEAVQGIRSQPCTSLGQGGRKLAADMPGTPCLVVSNNTSKAGTVFSRGCFND